MNAVDNTPLSDSSPLRSKRTLPLRLAGLGAALALALPLAACGGDDGGSATDSASGDMDLISSGTLSACSDVPYPPFDLVTDDGTYTGFDGDLMNEIATRLDLDLEERDQAFEGLQSGLALNSRQCDVVSAAMTITDERSENLTFSDGYYDSEQSLLVPEGSDVASIDDLDGVTVAVQQGTTGREYAMENAPDGADLVTFPSDGEMYTAIKAGQVDAILQDLPVNLDHVSDGGYEIVETYDTGEQYGFGFRKEGSEALVEAVNGALQDMRDDGTYDEIYNTYFDTEGASGGDAESDTGSPTDSPSS